MMNKKEIRKLGRKGYLCLPFSVHHSALSPMLTTKNWQLAGGGSMEFKEVVGRRRSIRYFLPWRPVPHEKIQIILEAARLASRAGNADFARAIVVERDKLAKADLQALTLP